LIFVGLLGLLNYFTASTLVHLWPWANSHLTAAWVLGLLFFVMQLVGPFGERLFFPGWKSRSLVLALNWASYLAFGVLSCLCAYLLAADIFIIAYVQLVQPADMAALNFSILIILSALTLSTTLIGIRQALSGPRIVRVNVPLKGLPRAFDGFRIVQISDLHTGPTIDRRYTEAVVRMAQDLKPDLIALTGDFADGHVEHMRDAVAPLADLHAPHGKFFITGNHEYYWGADAWCAHFRTLGARVLSNEHVLITHAGAAFVLAGVSDYSSAESDPKAALAGAPGGTVKILLAHQPASYRAAQAAGYDFQISGHTHGGQYFPFNLLIPLFQRFWKGLNRYRDMWIYVSRGTGYWGPPLRTFTPSEVTLLTLKSA
jgi:predicted MPP superfamily phosphohydrolase